MKTTTKIIKEWAARITMTLLVSVMTSATAWATNTVKNLDCCYGVKFGIYVQGWVYDPDDSSGSVSVWVQVYTDSGYDHQYGETYELTADVPRPDVNEAYNITGNHGFAATIPIPDEGTYWVRVYAIDYYDPKPYHDTVLTNVGLTTEVTVLGSILTDNDYSPDEAGYYYVNMPTNDSETVTLTDASITTFKVYDDGGKDGDYTIDNNSTLTLTAPEGYVIRLSGTIKSGPSFDYLTVYDSDTADGNILIYKAHPDKSYSPPLAISTVSSGPSMTLYFHSYHLTGGPSPTSGYAGLDLTVTIVPDIQYGINIKTWAGGIVTSDKATSRADEPVTLTSSPIVGHALCDLTVKDESDNPVDVTDMRWYTGTNTATFTMPASAVTVTPKFSEALTAEGGLYINVKVGERTTAIIPADVESFKIYDDGCSKYSSTLVLTATEGHLLQLSGNVTLARYDMVNVYDGTEELNSKLLCSVGEGQTSVGPITSSGQSITIGISMVAAGLDLTVRVIPIDYAVNIVGDGVGGSLISDKAVANVNQTITLTPSPKEGYHINSISVKDGNNNDVAVTDMHWYTGNQADMATFTMPASDVTITPEFCADADRYINMPTGSVINAPLIDAIIPEGISSFKVYDDGGKDGGWTNWSKGAIRLTAPEGYVFQLSGTMTAGDACAFIVMEGTVWNVNNYAMRVPSNGNGVRTEIPTYVSSGRNLVLATYDGSSVENYEGFEVTVRLIKLIDLQDGIDNRTTISANDGAFANVTLYGRTLWKNGDWNTLCLPFDVTDGDNSDDNTFSGTPLQGARVMELDTDGDYDGHKTGFDAESGTLYLYFKFVWAIEAGRPYIVYWPLPAADILNPVFSNVTIDASAPTAVTSEDGTVTFSGSYAPIVFPADDQTSLLFGSSNTLSHPAVDIEGTHAGTQLTTFRAYLKIPSPIDLNSLTDAVLGKTDQTLAADVNGDKQVNILDITALINILARGGLVKRVVSNVGLDLGH